MGLMNKIGSFVNSAKKNAGKLAIAGILALNLNGCINAGTINHPVLTQSQIVWQKKVKCGIFFQHDNTVYSSSRLEINDNKNNEYPLTQMPLEEGEKKLMDLALTATKEESWFVYNQDGRTFWLDCGKNQKSAQAKENIELVKSYLQDVWKIDKTVYFVHIHPVKGAAENYIQQNRELRRMFGMAGVVKVLLKNEGIFLSPSKNDYAASVLDKREMGGMGYKAISRVVSPSYVFEIGVSPKVTEEIKDWSESRIKRRIVSRYEENVIGFDNFDEKARKLRAIGYKLEIRKQREIDWRKFMDTYTPLK